MISEKSVARVQNNRVVYINSLTLDFIDAQPGEYLMTKEEMGKHGPYISLYKPESPEDLNLVERHKRKTGNGSE